MGFSTRYSTRRTHPDRRKKEIAAFVNGSVREEGLNRMSADDIHQLIQKMANQSGLEIIRIRKPQHTDNPSIQGQWHAFTNKPTSVNIKTFEGTLPQAQNAP